MDNFIMNEPSFDEPSAVEQNSPQRTPLSTRLWLLITLVSLLSGWGGGYLIWGRVPPATHNPDDGTGTSSEHQHEDPTVALVRQINPPEGYVLPLNYGDLGPRLLAAGAIQYEVFVQLYEQKGQPLTEEQQAILTQASQNPIVFNRQNANFLLNFFWAVGLVNQNSILTEGPIVEYGAGEIGRFASTGGWTLGTKTPVELYASTPLLSLTPEQQVHLEHVAGQVYRPCCNNPTHFPDCNHGMAMLGLLTLLASQDASEKQMYEAAKYANAFWFPQQTLEMAMFFQAAQNTEFAAVDAALLVGPNISSGEGFKNVHA
jgi:hypothetical protein